jgi:colanic acid biosynthesis glycosyl transferase WcaI
MACLGIMQNTSRPIRLRVLCQLFYPELISTGQTLTELCEAMAARGADIEVVSGPVTIVDRNTPVERDMVHAGVRIHRVWGTRFPKLNLVGRTINQLTYALSVMAYLLRHRDGRLIFVLTNPPFLAWICAFLKAVHLGSPYIYIVFDVYPETAINLGVLSANGIMAKTWRWLNGWAYRQAAAITVLGRCMERVVRRHLEAAAVEEDGRIQTVHMWADDANISACRGLPNPLTAEWGLENKFVVGYFGNMGRFHDIETIMEAAELLREHDDIVFLFVGEGHKKRMAQQFVESHGLTNCQFRTYVPREMLGFSLGTAHLGLVSLEQGQEGLSVPSKTYALLAAGVSPVALMAEDAEIALMIQEESCGVVLPQGMADRLADAILELYRDRVKLSEYRAAALRTSAKYTLASSADAYYALAGHITV